MGFVGVSMKGDIENEIIEINTRLNRINIERELLGKEETVLKERLWNLEKIINRDNDGEYNKD